MRTVLPPDLWVCGVAPGSLGVTVRIPAAVVLPTIVGGSMRPASRPHLASPPCQGGVGRGAWAGAPGHSAVVPRSPGAHVPSVAPDTQAVWIGVGVPALVVLPEAGAVVGGVAQRGRAD